MKLTERQAKLLTQLHGGAGASIVSEYLAPLLYEVRENQDNAASTSDMLRYQGQVRLLKQILRDIDGSVDTVEKFHTNRRNQ